MKTSLAIDSIHVREAPGIPGGLDPLQPLAPGINVIHGPNGSGKSTTLRLMQASISGGTGRGDDSRQDPDWTEAGVRAGDTAHRIVLRGRLPRHSDPPAPELDRQVVDLCRISLGELLEATDGARFGEALEEEAAGGTNLVRIAEKLRLNRLPFPRPTDRRALDTMHRQLEAAVRDSASHQENERELEDLSERRKSAQEGFQRKQLLATALEHRRQLDAAEKAAERLEAFPDSVGALTGQETDEIEKAETTISVSGDRLERALEDKEVAENDLRDSPLDGRLEAGMTARNEARATALEKLETEVIREEGLIKGSEKVMASSRILIGEEVADEALAGVGPDVLKRMAGWCDLIETLQGKRAAVGELRSQLGDLEDPPRKRTRENLEILRRWLAASKLDRQMGWGPVLLMVGALVMLLSGIVMGIIVDPWFLGLIPGALALCVAWWILRSERAGRVEADAVAGGFRIPETWDLPSVELLIAELEGELEAELEKRGRVRAWKDMLEARGSELREEEESLSGDREALLSELGFAPVLEEKCFGLLADQLRAWNEAFGRKQDAEEKVRELRGTMEEIRSEVRTDFAELGIPGLGGAFDSAVLKGWLGDLKDRDAAFAESTRSLEHAEQEIREAVATIDKAREAVRAIYSAAKVEIGDKASLAALVSRVEDYRDARSKSDGFRVVVQNAEKWFGENPSLAAASIEDLELDLGELGKPEEEIAEIDQRIGALEHDLREAKRATAVEEKRREFEEKREEYHSQRENRLERKAGWLLANHIHRKISAETVPEVQRRAGELLIRFTDGKCRVTVEGGTLKAVQPEVSSSPIELGKLSDGTRVQLFIAMRLAFIERQEMGYHLPLFLDEALANSDDRRAPTLIKALVEIASEGRQIFYFTSQADEAGKWRQILEATGIESTVLPIRRGSNLPRVSPPLEELPRIPAPAPGESLIDYRSKLGLPAKADPWLESVDQVLLAHVLEEAEDLARFQRIGVMAWGALAGIGPTGSGLKGGEPAYERAEKRARLILEVARTWQAGRGRPLERSDLESAGVTNTPTNDRCDQAWAIAEKFDRDAGRLCEALEERRESVSGLGKAGIESLRNFCEENGLIIDGEPLSDGEIRLRVMDSARRLGLDEGAAEEVLALFSA